MSSNGNKLFEFGSFRIDSGQRLFLRDEQPIHLSPKTFELLIFLVENPNQVIEKERFMDEVWKDSFVEDANLVVHISTLRKIFGTDSNASARIETFPKHGYRLEAVVSARSAYTDNGDGQVVDGEPKLAPEAGAQGGSRTKYLNVSVVAIAAIGILAIVWIGYAYLKREKTPFQNFTVSKFTTSGDIVNQSISPDGKYVAYWKRGEWFFEAGKPELWVKQIGTVTELKLAPPANGFDGPLTFSPDGKYIYFWEKPEQQKFIL